MSMRLAPAPKVAVVGGDMVEVKEDKVEVKEDMAVVKENTVVAAEDEGVTDDDRLAVVTNHRHTKNITIIT